MPKPIGCLSTALSQFAELFRPRFSHRQWKYFVIILLGVVGGKVSLGGLSRFFSRWQWSVVDVVQTWLSRFREQLEPQVQAEHHRQRVKK